MSLVEVSDAVSIVRDVAYLSTGPSLILAFRSPYPDCSQGKKGVGGLVLISMVSLVMNVSWLPTETTTGGVHSLDMIGFGDILFPDLLISFASRYDKIKKRVFFFHLSFSLISKLIVICFSIGLVVILELVRGELKELRTNGIEESEESNTLDNPVPEA